HARAVVILEFFERAKKHLGCCNVYGIAYLRPIDGDDEDIPVTLDQDTFHADPVWAPWPCHCCTLRCSVPRSTPSLFAAAVMLPPVVSSTRRICRRSSSASDR